MRMSTMIGKGALVTGAGVFAWLTQTFTPLFWVLVALVFIDALINIRDEETMWKKLLSGATSMGIPQLVSFNLHSPELPKIAVVVAILVYIKILTPQFRNMLVKMSTGANPTLTKKSVAILEQELAAAKAEAEKKLTAKEQQLQNTSTLSHTKGGK